MIEIVKWSECFESADTRKRQRLGWFLSPSGCDSKGFRKLMRDGKDGVTALGFFQSLCQAMATLNIATRQSGIFKNSDESLMDLDDILELSRLDGMELADYQQITGRLVACGWIRLHKSLISQQSASNLPPSCQSSAGFVQGEGEGQEEGQGEEEEKGDTPPAKSRGTIAEFRGYAVQLGLDANDGDYLHSHLSESGWKRGNVPIKDWKATMRKWKQGGWLPSQKQNSHGNHAGTSQPELIKNGF